MKIIIEDYQTGWANAFEIEKEVVASVLTDFSTVDWWVRCAMACKKTESLV